MRRFLTGWLVCALLCTLCACENAAGQADLQSIQKADVRELYEALLGIMLHTAMESEPIFPNRPWESCAVMRWFGLLGR